MNKDFQTKKEKAQMAKESTLIIDYKKTENGFEVELDERFRERTGNLQTIPKSLQTSDKDKTEILIDTTIALMQTADNPAVVMRKAMDKLNQAFKVEMDRIK